MSSADQRSRIRRRLLLFRYPLGAVILLLAFRFWHLQIVRGAEFSEIAQDNYLQTERRRAPRGLVLDRQGRILAESEPSFALLADSDGLRQLEAIGQLSADPEEMSELRTRAARGPTVVRSRIGFADAAFFEARARELSGVQVDFVPMRRYPLGKAAAHLVGYTGEVTGAQLLLEEFAAYAPRDIVGQSGIERAYNAQLVGSDGYFDRVVDSRQRMLEASGWRIEPMRGQTLRLGVSAAIQEAALAAFGDRAGAFVAIEVGTGEIVGLASYPAHAPREFQTDENAFRALRRDPRSPLLNRAVGGRYPPGSAFKLVTAAAALAEGVAGPDTRFLCRGQARVAGRTFRCHRASGHGLLTLREAISASCNVFFYRLSELLDVDVIAAYAREFGLGEPTGVDLPHETAGLVPTREWKRRATGERWYASETASVAVGQGALQVTPIQMARLTAAFASSGDLPAPRLVSPARSGRIERVSAQHFEMIRAGMRDAVLTGTAWRARVPGLTIAGKTGTAQVASLDRVAARDEDRAPMFRNHAWFVGFAPFEAPEVVVAVVVEHGGSGGAAAAPIGRAILAAWSTALPVGDGELTP